MDLFKSGQFHHVPIMLGDTGDENRMFTFYDTTPLNSSDYITELIFLFNKDYKDVC